MPDLTAFGNRIILNGPKFLKSTVQSRRVLKIQTKLSVMFIFESKVFALDKKTKGPKETEKPM